MQWLWSWLGTATLAGFFNGDLPSCYTAIIRPVPSRGQGDPIMSKAKPPTYKPVTYPQAAIDQMLATITFDSQGLVPAIAQQQGSGEVLMMAWMDRNAVIETMRTGRVCYWSRSRRAPWRKGDTSGHTQMLIDFRVDCDGDTLLVLVDQTGVACHTGRHNCFFRAIRGGELETIAPVVID